MCLVHPFADRSLHELERVSKTVPSNLMNGIIFQSALRGFWGQGHVARDLKFIWNTTRVGVKCHLQKNYQRQITSSWNSAEEWSY
jgi:hypothetical protein